MITVFTPTFNRCHTLTSVFDCLQSQTFKDFEWVIVDDGSTDSTKDLIESFQMKKKFTIKYLYQENQGKHIAINRGVELAERELFLIADSDDVFDMDALELFANTWLTIKSNSLVAGIWCLCKNSEGKIVGDSFPHKIKYMTLSDLQYKYKIEGEKWHIERTSVMREYPFPKISKGNGFYFGESNVWRQLYKDYKFFTLNHPLRTYIFSEDGIMNKMNANPLRYETLKLGFYNTLNEDIEYFFYSPILFIFQMSVFILYSRKDKTSFETMFFGFYNKWARALFVICYPLSYLMPILFLTNKYKFFRWSKK